jgi:hypothetical protein
MMNEMTVRELIKLLQSVPADLPVVVDSYEAGLDPVTDIKEIEVIPYPERKSYYGIFDQSHRHYPTARPALKIFSKRRGEEVGNVE